MNPILFLISLLGAQGAISQAPQPGGNLGLQPSPTVQHNFGGGKLQEPGGISCVSDADYRVIANAIKAASNSASSNSGRATRQYAFYPMAGVLWGDAFINNFVDLAPSAGAILDWDCTGYTYDGHDASDVDIRSFDEQTIGVPVFSALDGVVIAVHDGEPDRNTGWSNQPANFVVIDHGISQVCYYYHLKMNSVAVQVGDNVVAGQQIGQVGSSGNSTGPHLHFATYEAGQVVEPWTGPCNPGTSFWQDQVPIDRSVRVTELAVSNVSPGINGGLPFEMPRSGYVELYQPAYIWFKLNNLLAGSNWKLDYVNPQNQVVFSSGPQAYNNPTDWRGTWWWIWYHGPQFNNVVGQWEMRLYLNGTLAAEAPYEVVAPGNPKLNRAPEPVSIELGPIAPTSEGVFECKVQSTMVLDDLDYDVLSFRYLWSVNGIVVRDITSAALSDVIPSAWAVSGDQIQCSVFVGDGNDSLAPVTDGFVVSIPQMRITVPNPVSPGALGRVHVEQGQPGSVVHLAYGLALGTTPVPGCLGLDVDIQNASLGPNATIGANGAADINVFVPTSAQGRSFIIQSFSVTACEKSNYLLYSF